LFVLVAHDDLRPAQRAAFQELASQPDHFGLLMADTPLELSTKVVSRDTAQLLIALKTPGPLPDHVRDVASEDDSKALIQLIMDGVLEIETDRGFVSGPLASPYLRSSLGHDAIVGEPRTVPQRLSLEALELAASIPTDSPQELAGRMYRYNSLPLTPRWLRRFSASDNVLEMLELGATSSLRDLLFETYEEAEHPSWFMWKRLDAPTAPMSIDLPYKLYVSADPESLRETTVVAVETLVQANVPAFKLVRGAAGLLRPDKLIAYLENESDLRRVADSLRSALRGARPQGVPFSCAITDDGLLSWGSDPPGSDRLLGWQRTESWRSWITRRLAFAMVHANAVGDSSTVSWQFALERLRLENVDTNTWSPISGAGREA
jgi:hypothetical protein